jgi:hypothetical protein
MAIMSFTGVISRFLSHSWYSNREGIFVILSSNQAPANAATIAGMPNLRRTSLSAFFPTRVTLKRLFEKCTTPVNAIAMSIGKKIAKTGIKIVPSPNPEKNVRMAVKKATRLIRIMSITT